MRIYSGCTSKLSSASLMEITFLLLNEGRVSQCLIQSQIDTVGNNNSVSLVLPPIFHLSEVDEGGLSLKLTLPRTLGNISL